MNITYSGGNNITATGIYPSQTAVATKDFTVSGNNTTGNKMGYSLNLVMDENTFSIAALKYKLTSTNTGANGEVVPSISTMKDLYIGPSTNLLGIGYFNQTSGNKTHTYKLEIYFPESGENQNEDQGRTFRSHVVISDMACTDCLKDNILAQDGGVNTINAKTTPSFNQIAPILLTYKENISEYPYEHVSYEDLNNLYIGTGYIFNTTTGLFTLTNQVEIQSYESNHIGKYTCGIFAGYSDCYEIYKINAVSGTTVTNSMVYKREENAYNLSDTGIYKAEDEYGTSYYYRGAKNHLKNNIIFAEQQWKIIRINGDGSIRLLYNGTCPGNECSMISTGTDINISLTGYNTNNNDNKFIGYMYGNTSDSYANAHANINNSIVKTTLDNWYNTNINLKGYGNKVVDNIFCNDRSIASAATHNFLYGSPPKGTGFGTSPTAYKGYERIELTTKTPNLKCEQVNDQFTVLSSSKGNKVLTYPVGLITADETSLGGLVKGTSNSKNYLYSGVYYWTLSPHAYNGSGSFGATMYFVDVDGKVRGVLFGGSTLTGARPVINLASDVKITGDGSETAPFKVV